MRGFMGCCQYRKHPRIAQKKKGKKWNLLQLLKKLEIIAQLGLMGIGNMQFLCKKICRTCCLKKVQEAALCLLQSEKKKELTGWEVESGRICYTLWISCVLARFRGSDKLDLGQWLRSSIFSNHTLRNNFLHTSKHTQGVKSNPHLLLPQQPPVKRPSSSPHLFLLKKQMNRWWREKRGKENKGGKQMKHRRGCRVGSL